MNRKSIFVAGVLLVASLAGSAAEAHQIGCLSQADRNVKIRNRAGSQAAAAIADWDTMTILNITLVSSGEEIDVFYSNSGNTGWAGLASFTSTDGCTILHATAQGNTYYYSPTSTATRGIFCQEIAHGFGLDHSNDGGCMGAGYWYSVTSAYRPVTHNVNDIATIYANKSLKHGGEEQEGAGAVRFHAYWFNTPRTLGEATRMADAVVVATVDAVTEGDDIVSFHSDGVQSLPSQRVHFTVQSGRKGGLRNGESFVLFQNGNEENRFNEDPSYKVGRRYLMFLSAREDGTFRVLSPEGRYEVSSRGLIPAAQKGFAQALDGARLPDVLADVNRSLAADVQKD